MDFPLPPIRRMYPVGGRGLGRFFGVEDGSGNWISPVTGEGVPPRPWLRKYPKTADFIAASTTPSPRIAEIGLTAGMALAING